MREGRSMHAGAFLMPLSAPFPPWLLTLGDFLGVRGGIRKRFSGDQAEGEQQRGRSSPEEGPSPAPHLPAGILALLL
jgi:hypothetical protein